MLKIKFAPADHRYQPLQSKNRDKTVEKVGFLYNKWDFMLHLDILCFKMPYLWKKYACIFIPAKVGQGHKKVGQQAFLSTVPI